MTEVLIIVLALAVVVQAFILYKISYEAKELRKLVFSSSSYKLLGRLEELEETVDSHWSATQRDINIIWGNINGVEYYDGEEEKEEETNGEDGAAEM